MMRHYVPPCHRLSARQTGRPRYDIFRGPALATLARPSTGSAPLRSLLSTKGGGRSQISNAPPSPQSNNLRVGPQLPLHIVTAGPEDDASGAAGLELGETFAQLLASSVRLYGPASSATFGAPTPEDHKGVERSPGAVSDFESESESRTRSPSE
jgi:hypothetical protein